MKISKKLIKKLKKIELIITDVDGVLTDGSLFITTQKAEPFGKFHIMDGFAIKDMAPKCGVDFMVISGRKSEITEGRCHNLGIKHAFTGVADKKAKLLELQQELNIDFSKTAYIGDDLIDLGVMSLVAVTVSPANGVKEVRKRVDIVTKKDGGAGCVREFVELVLSTQGKLNDFVKSYL